MSLLLTRPAPESLQIAALLAEEVIETHIAPMLHIIHHAQAIIDTEQLEQASFTAVVATSKHALDGFSAPLLLPLHMVGEQAALEAAESGWQIASISPNSAALIEQLAQIFKPHDALLYLRGQDVSTNLTLTCPQFQWHEVVTYVAAATHHLPDTTKQALRHGEIDAVLLFSKRSAELFEATLAQENLTPPPLLALCLSEQVADALSASFWQSKRVAAKPTRAELLTLAKKAVRPA